MKRDACASPHIWRMAVRFLSIYGVKELTGGFAILNAKSKEEAIELTKGFLALAGDGECEVRQLYSPGDEIHGCAGVDAKELATA